MKKKKLIKRVKELEVKIEKLEYTIRLLNTRAAPMLFDPAAPPYRISCESGPIESYGKDNPLTADSNIWDIAKKLGSTGSV